MEGVLGLRGAVWSEGPLVWVWWRRPGLRPRKSTLALGLEVRRGRELRVITYMQSEIFFYSRF